MRKAENVELADDVQEAIVAIERELSIDLAPVLRVEAARQEYWRKLTLATLRLAPKRMKIVVTTGGTFKDDFSVIEIRNGYCIRLAICDGRSDQ